MNKVKRQPRDITVAEAHKLSLIFYEAVRFRTTGDNAGAIEFSQVYQREFLRYAYDMTDDDYNGLDKEADSFNISLPEYINLLLLRGTDKNVSCLPDGFGLKKKQGTKGKR